MTNSSILWHKKRLLCKYIIKSISYLNKKISLAFCGVAESLHKKELKKLNYEKRDLHNDKFDYIIMTNRVVEKKNNNVLEEVKTCFQKYEGKDLITIERNGLILSTLREIQ